MNGNFFVKSTFEDFYKKFGLLEYPFAIYTTENEKDKVNDLFISPNDYAPIIESFNKGLTMIIIGNRGTGKTALLYDLINKQNSSDNIICSLEDYSDLSINSDLTDFYKLIITKLSIKLFDTLITQKYRIKELNKEERLLLSFLLKNYVKGVTRKSLIEKIEKIQTPVTVRGLKKTYNYCRFLLNYGFTATTSLISDAITRHFSNLPPITVGKVREYLPELSTEIDGGFLNNETSYYLIERILNVIEKMKFNKVIVAFDKLDEDSRLKNDAENIAEFIEPLLTDNKLLLNSNIQLIISIWLVPFNHLKDTVRTQKHFCPVINWDRADLIKALNQRLYIYSGKKINNYKELFIDNVDENLIEKVFELSNSNPRDLWHIFNRLFEAQYELDSESDKISNEGIIKGINNFVINFNFYEYYPKKSNARANTMDVYSYIKHLLKLKNARFTKNQLNEKAGTGGSTNNYVVGMENIGLIKKDGQQSGNVIYKINDPKIVFALENQLDVS